MKKDQNLTGIDIDKPIEKDHFMIKLNSNKLTQYNVSPQSVTVALRSFLEGSILYSINDGNEEIDVRLTVPDKYKDKVENLLKIQVENNLGQMTNLEKLVSIKKEKRPISIKRSDFKRSTMIYASIAKNKKATPLEIAEKYENGLFQEIVKKFPTTVLSFKREIEDTRESSNEFIQSIVLVVLIIYFILIVMFNSLVTPLYILSIVPFGVSGVILAYFCSWYKSFWIYVRD